jgi:hypothetical protein
MITNKATDPAGSDQEVQAQQRLEKKEREPLTPRLRRLLIKHPKYLVFGWAIVVLAFLLLVPAAYVFWYFLPGQLWEVIDQWWLWIPASFGFIILLAIPIWSVMGAVAVASFLTDVSLAVEDASLHKTERNVLETEQEAINRLEQTDTAGLLPLLKYSRAQLVAYYEIGLRQTRGSFFNAVLAMWLGFILLLIGIALYVGPVEKLGLTRPPQDFNVLILSGAAIVEFISALFLWVYRNTIAQLTYYYRLQMHSHTSILCFRMASSMQEADETKRAIIENVLGWAAQPERPPVVGAKGLRALLSTSGPKMAPTDNG